MDMYGQWFIKFEANVPKKNGINLVLSTKDILQKQIFEA